MNTNGISRASRSRAARAIAFALTLTLAGMPSVAGVTSVRECPTVRTADAKGDFKLSLAGTALAPGARGALQIDFQRKKERMALELTARGLPAPKIFGAEYLTYVAWGVDRDGFVDNLGRVERKPDSKARWMSRIPEREYFGFLVTAEPYAAVRQPSELIVLRAATDKRTARLTWSDAECELVSRDGYRLDRSAEELELTLGGSSAGLVEAHNALSIAERSGAKELAPELLDRARRKMIEARRLAGAKKTRAASAASARDAVEIAEVARRMAVERRGEGAAVPVQPLAAEVPLAPAEAALPARQDTELDRLQRKVLELQILQLESLRASQVSVVPAQAPAVVEVAPSTFEPGATAMTEPAAVETLAVESRPALAAAFEPAIDPLATERQALDEERRALEFERVRLEAERSAAERLAADRGALAAERAELDTMRRTLDRERVTAVAVVPQAAPVFLDEFSEEEPYADEETVAQIDDSADDDAFLMEYPVAAGKRQWRFWRKKNPTADPAPFPAPERSETNPPAAASSPTLSERAEFEIARASLQAERSRFEAERAVAEKAAPMPAVTVVAPPPVVKTDAPADTQRLDRAVDALNEATRTLGQRAAAAPIPAAALVPDAMSLATADAERLSAIEQQLHAISERLDRPSPVTEQPAPVAAAAPAPVAMPVAPTWRRQLLAMGGISTDRGVLLRLEGLDFPPGSADLPTSAREQLARLAGVLMAEWNIAIDVEGHTDNTGSPAGHIALSEKRAEAVKNYLRLSGLEQQSIQWRGLGERHPIADNSDPDGRRQNRRVELVVRRLDS